MPTAKAFDFSGVSTLDRLLSHRLLTAEEEVELAKRIEAGDEAAKHMLVRHNVRLVASLARRYAGGPVELDDLVAEGIEGLFRAAEKFDWRRGFKFSTYATWWVRQAVQAALRRASRAPAAVSLDAPVGDDGEGRLAGLVADPAGGPEAAADAVGDRQAARNLLAALGPFERSVLVGRLGLDGGPPRTAAALAAALGAPEHRVRAAEGRALAVLRHPASAAWAGE